MARKNGRKVRAVPWIVPKLYQGRVLERLNATEVIKVTVAPEGNAAGCYGNVALKVEESGGHRKLGWMLTNIGNIFVECCHHAVWQTPDGELLCVTKPTSDVAVQGFISFASCADQEDSWNYPPSIPMIFFGLKKGVNLSELRRSHQRMIEKSAEIKNLVMESGGTYTPRVGFSADPRASFDLVQRLSLLKQEEEVLARQYFDVRKDLLKA